jgi:hypothetical protein
MKVMRVFLLKPLFQPGEGRFEKSLRDFLPDGSLP